MSDTQLTDESGLIRFYKTAKRWVEENSAWRLSDVGKYGRESLTAPQFLADYAWTVYVSAFRAKTVSDKWDALNAAWQGFEPTRMTESARDAALAVIGHRNKGRAILQVAAFIQAKT